MNARNVEDGKATDDVGIELNLLERDQGYHLAWMITITMIRIKDSSIDYQRKYDNKEHGNWYSVKGLLVDKE